METRPINEQANLLHLEAREAGQGGDYQLAIQKLLEAMSIEPNWAYPVYDLAFTYLLVGDFDNALKYYQETDNLEPDGFFTTKTAIYTLEGEKLGLFPEGLYTFFMQIEWTDEPEKKYHIAKQIVDNVPSFAPAWKELAYLQTDPEERLYSIEQGLAGNPDRETKGILLLNKAMIFSEKGEKDIARKLLSEIIDSQETTISNSEIAKVALKSIKDN
ncbi:MAG: tetratricopeptide repeat protein [Fluviicola sp.]